MAYRGISVTAIIMALFLAACSNSQAPDTDGGTSPGPGEKSFRQDILPIFNNNGCSGCHGGNGGLTVSSVAALLRGGDHGPAIIATDADGSLLVRKLSSSPPFGSRMPLGGPHLSNNTVDVIRTWINEGAKNN